MQSIVSLSKYTLLILLLTVNTLAQESTAKIDTLNKEVLFQIIEGVENGLEEYKGELKNEGDTWQEFDSKVSINKDADEYIEIWEDGTRIYRVKFEFNRLSGSPYLKSLELFLYLNNHLKEDKWERKPRPEISDNSFHSEYASKDRPIEILLIQPRQPNSDNKYEVVLSIVKSTP